jgi:hypothetical protein
MKFWSVLIVCVAAPVCALSAAADEQAPTAELAWFTDAAIDNSIRLAEPPEAFPEAPGTFGKGVRLTKTVAIDVPVLAQGRGYISFWIKPDWNGDDGKVHRILRIGDPEKNGLLVEKSDQGLLRFVMASPKRVSAARADVSGWKAGQWHQVTLIWLDFRDKPLGLPIWIDRKIAAGPITADNAFLDPAAMDDARLYLGDETSDAVIDELIIRNKLTTELSPRPRHVVYRDYFRTAPYSTVRIDPEPLRVPADRRVVAGYPKQFGLEGKLPGGYEDMTDFVEQYDNWNHFDAKPLIRWSTTDPEIATVDENGRVTGQRVGRCTLIAQFRDMTAKYPLEVIPVEQPDLDLAWVERLPRYDWNSRKPEPEAGDTVQSVAHIFNMGFEPVPAGTVVTLELFPELTADYAVDRTEERRAVVQKQTIGALAPRKEAVVTFEWTWPEKPVWVRVTVDPRNRVKEICEANNQVCDLNTARAVRWAYEPKEVNKFLDERTMTLTGSFSVYDWDQACVARLNGMLREAVFPTTSPHGVDYAVRLDANLWRGDFIAGDRYGPYRDRRPEEKYDGKWWRGGWPHNEIEFPLALESAIIHELGHTMLALPDLYGGPIDEHRCYLRDEDGKFYEGGELLPYIARHNIIPRPPIAGFTACGEGYPSLMDACTMWIAEENAAKMQYYRNLADRPFWGSQGPLVPGWRNWLYVTDVNDQPLAGAAVYVYQVEQPPISVNGRQYFYDRPKFVGHTDDEGRFFFQKQTDWVWDDPKTDEVDGEVQIWNPFGRAEQPIANTPDCYGYDGLFLIKIVAGDLTEFHYVTLGEFNLAFYTSKGEGEYPIRTSLKPSDRRTRVVRPKIPEAIRKQNLRPVAVPAQRALKAKVGEEFTLDGTQSYDPEGQELVLYEWQLDDGKAAPWRKAGAVITAKAEEPGTVRYLLYVNDGVRASEPVRVTITVVAADAEVETGAEQGGDENESNGD